MTAPFGTLALAPELEHFTVDTAAGPLTAFRVIPQAGHLPNLDNPGFTAAMLNDFWASTS